MDRLTLRKNFAWAFAGNAVSAFCMWLLLLVLTKLGAPEIVGIYAVAQAISLPISRFLGLQLPIVQVTDAQNDYCFGHYFTLKLITGILAICISVGAGFVFYSVDVALVIVLLSFGYGIIEIRKVFLTVMQKSERMDKVAVSNILQGALSAIFFGIIFWLSRQLVLSILGIIVARLMVLFFYDNPVAGKFLRMYAHDGRPDSQKLIWARRKLWRLARTAIPLGLVGCFGMLFTSIPRLVLDKYFGKAEVGYFAAISSLLVVGTMGIAALSQAVIPRLAKYYFENIRGYKLLIGKLVGIGFAMGISGVVISSLFGKWILTMLFRPDYARYNYVFIWITVAGTGLFLFTFMNCGLNAARKFKIQVPIYGLAAGLCGVLSLLLIPHYGMIGAAWSIIGCYGFGAISSGIFVGLALREKSAQEA